MKKRIGNMILMISMILGLCAPAKVYATSVQEIDTLVSNIPYELWPEAPIIDSKTAIVVERNSGIILYEKNCTEAKYPASTTKLLTALITLEKTTMEDIVTFSWKSVNTIGSGASHIGMRTGDRLKIYDCLCGLLLPSANEVANALAEHISGTVEDFASLMNERGKELGLINSNFENANGLHADNHYTCAYDLYLIMDACLEIPAFVEIDSKTAYVKKADEVLGHDIPMGTTHKMLKKNSEYYNENAICGKTGYTDQAGRVLATYAEKDGMELICITMGGTGQNHFVDTNKLLDYGFSNFSITQLTADSNQENNISQISPLQIEREAFIEREALEQGEIILPKTLSIDDLKRSVRTDTDGTKYMEYKATNYVLGSVKITEDEERNNAIQVKEYYQSKLVKVDGPLYVIGMIMLAGIAIMFVAFIAFFIYSIFAQKSKKVVVKIHKPTGTKNRADESVKYSKKLKKGLSKKD